jgi:hypothetical protein
LKNIERPEGRTREIAGAASRGQDHPGERAIQGEGPSKGKGHPDHPWQAHPVGPRKILTYTVIIESNIVLRAVIREVLFRKIGVSILLSDVFGSRIFKPVSDVVPMGILSLSSWSSPGN